ncbi:MAG: hypothetical protein A2X37_10785 [Elusimicrobia bacterium GWA2_66_18]|nr:MAG: hypothetical protein A2X37_10785 [Elusimicrobia bacterium GWA2_66_18]
MEAFADEMVHHAHRTLQQSFMRYIWVLLQAWAACKKQGCFDLRNEATVEMAEKIVNQFENDAAFPFI